MISLLCHYIFVNYEKYYFVQLQALQKKWTACKVSPEFDDISQCLCRLPFLRADLIKYAISGLQKKVTEKNNGNLNTFWRYFLVQWGQDQMVEIISICGEEFRMNGTCEHFHKEWFRLVNAHPEFYKFVGNYYLLAAKILSTSEYALRYTNTHVLDHTNYNGSHHKGHSTTNIQIDGH